MFGMSLLANAPLSFLTGLLLTLACRWVEGAGGSAVARVYIAEALGSFLGGIAVTVMLSLNGAAETVFLLSTMVIALAILVFRWHARRYVSAWVFVLLVAAVLITGVDRQWTRQRLEYTWTRILPAETWQGWFPTAQANYLYGEGQGQFNVMAWESVIESIPNTLHGAEIAALNMVQHPAAKRILVIGAGSFSVCNALLALPQVNRVTWLDPDPEYPSRLLRVLPSRYRDRLQRLRTPEQEARKYLRAEKPVFDMIILNLPDATTLVLNRYFSVEFFSLLRRRLAPGGVVSVRSSGGANFMGSELVALGASIYATLSSVFPEMALKPGDETWFIASDTGRPVQSPHVLAQRWQQIPGATNLYPAAGLQALYQQNRADFQLKAYRRAVEETEAGQLINADRTPRALLHSLLFLTRHEGGAFSFSAWVGKLNRSGVPLLLIVMALFVVLRGVYLAHSPRDTEHPRVPSAYDSGWLVFNAGALAMAVSVLLMFMYQSRFGSIFLNIGLISSLFMLGIFSGGMLAERFLARHPGYSLPLLAGALVLHIMACLLLSLLPPIMAQRIFIGLFFAYGVLSGVYVPVAAQHLAMLGYDVRRAGAMVETDDHLGGALGGLGCGIFLLPLFGLQRTLLVLSAFLAINLCLLPFCGYRPTLLQDAFRRRFRMFGYVLFGIAALVLITPRLFEKEQAVIAQNAMVELAAIHYPGIQWAGRDTVWQGQDFEYAEAPDAPDNAPRYAFPTLPLTPGINGYAGPIGMLLFTDGAGRLLDFKITRSQETPGYMTRIIQWAQQCKGRNIFQPDSLQHVDAMSGATYTSLAVRDSIQAAGRRFGALVNMTEKQPAEAQGFNWTWSAEVVFMLVLSGVVILLRRRANRYIRWFILVVVAVVAGVLMNIQYSLDHVFLLLGGNIPRHGVSVPLLLIIGVPLLVLLFGNVYCGYLCPFGALQEWMGYLRPRRWRTAPSTRILRYARMLKYLLLFGMVIIFVLGQNRDFLLYDPLVNIFNPNGHPAVFKLCIALLILSIVFPRFWCRALCPAGAWLALLNGLHLLRRWIPRVPWRRCSYGVQAPDELDCICCDRCVFHARTGRTHAAPSSGGRGADLCYGVALAVILGWWVTLIWQAPEADTAPDPVVTVPHVSAPAMTPEVTASSEPERRVRSTGVPRKANVSRIRRMIRRNRLSDHEAMYYEQLPQE
jgi:spermidine synthase